MQLQYCLLGTVGYQDALALQERLLTLRQQQKISDVLLLLEHPPVITLGKKAKDANVVVAPEILAKQGVELHTVSRGGDVTYHGPGQIVGYPILDLTNHGRDIRKFIRNVEEVFIQLLGDQYGIRASRDTNYTGVWVKDKKITAIGFAIKRWVTMHGFAFNVDTNLTHFQWINPCGILDRGGVTSLNELVEQKVHCTQVNGQVVDYFSSIFKQQPKQITRTQLDELLGS